MDALVTGHDHCAGDLREREQVVVVRVVAERRAPPWVEDNGRGRGHMVDELRRIGGADAHGDPWACDHGLQLVEELRRDDQLVAAVLRGDQKLRRRAIWADGSSDQDVGIEDGTQS
jgi:hypothetical protein